eukprot:CAMPEP_0182584510 /NCGR_PEP_ID=MMETSP1324-20130603/57990_1 /TAXON_ID=236786 /ORGANISM="Florenciella sp., Strain RCC1587" /LENGTH=194 /DNA_ID=CAMNT_0024801217 /DNA_START=1 /DNA_END=581 /DNA_ORIENTATION=+
MPSDEFVIFDGPERNLLNLICRNVRRSEAITVFLEDYKVVWQSLSIPAYIIPLVALTGRPGDVTFSLRWIIVAAYPDLSRCMFKLNRQAAKRVLHEMDFWLPAATLLLGTLSGAWSCSFEPGLCLVFATYFIAYVILVLLDDADLSERVVDGGNDPVLYLIVLAIVGALVVIFLFGFCPAAESKLLYIEIINRT